MATTAPVIFSLVLLLPHPQLAERGLQFRDLLVMHVTEGRQLKLTIMDETARAAHISGMRAGSFSCRASA
jgi:hypothetical protein